MIGNPVGCQESLILVTPSNELSPSKEPLPSESLVKRTYVSHDQTMLRRNLLVCRQRTKNMILSMKFELPAGLTDSLLVGPIYWGKEGGGGGGRSERSGSVGY